MTRHARARRVPARGRRVATGAVAVGLACAALAACGPAAVRNPTGAPWPPPPPTASLADRVVRDFEHATLTSVEAFAGLFDFAEVGAFEILLHRYDLLGRIPDLTADEVAELAAEGPTPYPAARERRNVSAFYPRFVQRTVGTGGCTAGPARSEYVAQLAAPFAPLPAEHAHYEPLRARVNAQLVGGGMVTVRCRGGHGGLALVYSPRPTTRGYDLITIYDDGDD